MAIKWLDAKRLQGTNAERLALTTGVSTANCLGLWTFQEQTGDVINIATTGNGFADGLGSAADGEPSGTNPSLFERTGSIWKQIVGGSDSEITSGTSSRDALRRIVRQLASLLLRPRPCRCLLVLAP